MKPIVKVIDKQIESESIKTTLSTATDINLDVYDFAYMEASFIFKYANNKKSDLKEMLEHPTLLEYAVSKIGSGEQVLILDTIPVYGAYQEIEGVEKDSILRFVDNDIITTSVVSWAKQPEDDHKLAITRRYTSEHFDKISAFSEVGTVKITRRIEIYDRMGIDYTGKLDIDYLLSGVNR